jgi:electron transfer flavoprotein beta subunit
LKIIVCVKQAQGSGAVFDENGLTVRSGGRLNQNDARAVAAALKIREYFGGEVVALSMGALSAKQILKEVVAMGVDSGVLINGDEFRGADVYATAYALLQGIKKLGGADLIVCGERTSDGGTAQTPFSLAAQADIPVVGFIKKFEIRDGEPFFTRESNGTQREVSASSAAQADIPVVGFIKKFEIKDGELFFTQELSGISQEVAACFPMVAAFSEFAAAPIAPSLKGLLRAEKTEIKVLGLSDLEDKNAAHYGLAASPTRVKRVAPLTYKAKSEPIFEVAEKAAERILKAVLRFSDE